MSWTHKWFCYEPRSAGERKELINLAIQNGFWVSVKEHQLIFNIPIKPIEQITAPCLFSADPAPNLDIPVSKEQFVWIIKHFRAKTALESL